MSIKQFVAMLIQAIVFVTVIALTSQFTKTNLVEHAVSSLIALSTGLAAFYQADKEKSYSWKFFAKWLALNLMVDFVLVLVLWYNVPILFHLFKY